MYIQKYMHHTYRCIYVIHMYVYSPIHTLGAITHITILLCVEALNKCFLNDLTSLRK